MTSSRITKTRNIIATGALVLAGFGGGVLLATGGIADAASGSSSASSSTGTAGGHTGETPLTGTTAAKVRAAALAKYPGATVERVETDSDGVYEAHIVTEAGASLVVQVDKSFTVTGTETFTGRGPGPRDGDGPDETASPAPDES
jgi:hypothetical protein